MDFKGKTALVIEGNRRIGAAASLALAGQGARVIILSSCEDKKFLKRAGKLIKRIHIIKATPKQIISKMKKVAKSVDIIINYINTEKYVNPGIDDKRGWDALFTINSQFFFGCLESLIPLLIKRGRGRIVNVGDSPVLPSILYLSMRRKIAQFTKTIGRELARKNINVNAVIPGPLEGEDYTHIRRSHAKELDLYFPLDRPAKMNEIIEPILFLASKKASYIYAETINVDAGFTA